MSEAESEREGGKGRTGETVIMCPGRGRKESGIALQGPSLDSLEQLWASPPPSFFRISSCWKNIWLFGISEDLLWFRILKETCKGFGKRSCCFPLFLLYDSLITHDSPFSSFISLEFRIGWSIWSGQVWRVRGNMLGLFIPWEKKYNLRIKLKKNQNQFSIDK